MEVEQNEIQETLEEIKNEPEAVKDPQETVDGQTPAEDKTPEAEPEKEPEVTLLDGTVVPLSEAIAGYMKGRDYTQKTQQLAEERRALQTYQPQPPVVKPPVQTEEEDEFDPDQFAKLKKALLKQGFVSREDLQKEQEQQMVQQQELSKREVLTGFIEEHPEYKDSIFLKQLDAEIIKYNHQDPKLFKWALTKAHGDVVEKMNDVVLKNKTVIARKSVDVASSSGAGSVKPPTTQKETYLPDEIEIAKAYGNWDEATQTIKY